MKRQPNILLLMADELRADCTGFGGNPVVRTPHLDALAAKATVFDNAYTPAPICIPARQCLAAGQLPTTCGCLRWYDDLPAGALTFPRLLSRQGYETVACGKLHHVGPDQMQGYTKRIGAECEVAQPYIPGLERPFDAFAQKWSQEEEVLRATDRGKSYHIRQDELAVLGAEYFIEQYFCDPLYGRNTPDRPLLLTVSFNQPHYPYVADPALLAYYGPRVAPYENEPVFPHPFLSKFQVQAPPAALRRATAAYYAMIERMDGYVGRVTAALAAAGQRLEDWLVLFASDHGEMLGQHGVWEKQKFFEGSARVPLLVGLPGQQAGRHCAKNVSLCDVYATVCETAGLTVPPGLDSRSLVPLAAGDEDGWPDTAVSMFDGVNFMYKKGARKYQWYGAPQSEVLFDLAADPTERENLLGRPAYADFVEEGRAQAARYGFPAAG